MEENTQRQEPPEPIEANRLPFDQTLLQEAEDFMEKVLKQVPEIGGLALVPIWINPGENMPPGFLRLRNPKEPPMAPILQLVQNMAKFSLMLDRELLNQYKFFDERVAELVKKFEDASDKARAADNT